MTHHTLLLLRHAKSSWDDANLDDFDRPLADRGRKAAPRMAAEMAARGWRPDAALVSSSLRTRQTWELAAGALGPDIAATFSDAIYEAPAERILENIRLTPDSISVLLVIGHNPGFENLARLLASSDNDPVAVAHLKRKFPTAAVARLTFEGAWRDLGQARLTDFLTPKQLI